MSANPDFGFQLETDSPESDYCGWAGWLSGALVLAAIVNSRGPIRVRDLATGNVVARHWPARRGGLSFWQADYLDEYDKTHVWTDTPDARFATILRLRLARDIVLDAKPGRLSPRVAARTDALLDALGL